MKTLPLILGREHAPETSQRVRPTAAESSIPSEWQRGSDGTVLPRGECLKSSAPANKAGIYKTGLTLGVLFAAFHLLWICLVSIGWAQPALNFVFWAHMIQPIYVVKPFDLFAALILIAFTFSTGFVLGSLGALLWNNLHRTHEQTQH